MCSDPSPVVPQSVDAEKEPWIFIGIYGTVGVPLYAYTMGKSVAPPGSNAGFAVYKSVCVNAYSTC
jgi:hypothetical protein